MVVPPLKCICIPYLWQMFLKLSQIPWEYGATIWHIFLIDDWLCLFVLVLSSWCCCCWSVSCIAHLGYLQHLRTSSRCSNPLLINSGVEHKVLTQCLRVLMTLYFDAKLWLLSHWMYWSVCVGFLYTFMVKVPSTLGVTKISKMGWNHLVQLPPQWSGRMYPLYWYVGRIPLCVTFVELQRYHLHIFSTSLEGSGQCWWLYPQMPSYKYLPQLDLLVIPWQHLWFVQSIGSGKGSNITY